MSKKEDLVKDYLETQPKLVQHFSQGFLVNTIKENVTTAINNFGNRGLHIDAAIQNIGKLKPTSAFNQAVKEDATKTYSKYKIINDLDGDLGDDQDGDLGDDQDGNQDGNQEDEKEPTIEAVSESDAKIEQEGGEEPTIEAVSESGATIEQEDEKEPAIEAVSESGATIEQEDGEEDMKAEIVKEEEIRVDKKIKKLAGDQNVFLTVGNTAYQLDGKLVSFVLTKPTIDKNDFVDDSYESGDLFTLETPIELK